VEGDGVGCDWLAGGWVDEQGAVVVGGEAEVLAALSEAV
jgi:hypothetical protein